ncbi:AAA family ATPase [Mycobacterium sp. M23085]|uniref:AAA family ATPase n=1 Tax=Mycobacterium sp. M23085 TaxID=3378087 RepID=UPI0038783A5D
MSDDLIARGKQIAESGKYRPSVNGVAHATPPARHRDDPGDQEPPINESEPPPPADSEDDNEGAIQHRLHVLRINYEARCRLDEENRPQVALPPVKSLDVLLAEPDSPVRYRIEGLAPTESRIILSAQFKAGKTIMVGNLLRSLVDGDKFLGAFTVNATAKRVVLIDDELSENTLRHWLRDQNITDTAAVADVIALRGRVSAFNLLDDRCRDMWATRLRDLGCDYLMLDCLRPVIDALGLDENHDAGRFLAAYDALLTEAGVSDSLMVQHMGHTNERARGDSRLQDWPDAIWRLVRETEDPNSPRYFSAYGRDVNITEGRLSYDPVKRRLTYAAGSRLDAKTEAARRAVVRLLAKSRAELSGNAIENDPALADYSRKPIRAALKRAIEDGFVTVTDGPRGAKLHRINYPCEQCGMPVVGGGTRHESCPEEPDPELFE